MDTPTLCTPDCRPAHHVHRCAQCDLVFTCKRSDQRFCSSACGHKQRAGRYAEKRCAHTGCSGWALPGLRSGYCEMHYRRDKDGRDMDLPKKGSGAKCVVEGCERKAEERGMCTMHRIRVRRTGEPGEPAPRQEVQQDVCSVDGCHRRARSKQLCGMHFQRYRATGDVGPAERLHRAFGEGHVDRNGYIAIQIAGRKTLQHRYVMEQTLGRRLKRHETVHHRNGVRSDNRPENLELWLSGHPCGQRAEDFVAFVVENYPEATRAALDGEQLTLSLF